ncbi:hypothetical protein D9M72_546730 [compost metagenome]
MAAEQPRDQARILQFARTDHHVEGLRHQIDAPWCQVEIEGDAGIAPGEFRDQRRHVDGCEIDRHRHAQEAARLLQHGAELFVGQARFVDDAFAALIVELARFGELDLACRAVEQPQPDRFLQCADPSRQGGVGHADDFGRFAKASGFRHFDEQCHVVQMGHRIAPSVE